jgi:hypothetical protein
MENMLSREGGEGQGERAKIYRRQGSFSTSGKSKLLKLCESSVVLSVTYFEFSNTERTEKTQRTTETPFQDHEKLLTTDELAAAFA